MLIRMLKLASFDGTVCAVTPQNWLYLGGYKKMRKDILNSATLNLIGALGARAFETITGEVVSAALVEVSAKRPDSKSKFIGIDVNDLDTPHKKMTALRDGGLIKLDQATQIANPDNKISMDEMSSLPLLKNYVTALAGCLSGDSTRFIRNIGKYIQ